MKRIADLGIRWRGRNSRRTMDVLEVCGSGVNSEIVVLYDQDTNRFHSMRVRRGIPQWNGAENIDCVSRYLPRRYARTAMDGYVVLIPKRRIEAFCRIYE